MLYINSNNLHLTIRSSSIIYLHIRIHQNNTYKRQLLSLGLITRLSCYAMMSWMPSFLIQQQTLAALGKSSKRKGSLSKEKAIILMNQSKNLKTFVSKFIEDRAVESFPHLYIVDKQTGPFRRIQEAIDAAEPNSLIKISEGFYEQNLVITKPVRLEPKNMNEECDKIGVVILASGGVAVHIKLSEYDHECEITGMKFSHSGNSDSNLKKELMEHEHILNIFQHHENIEQLESEFVNRMTANKMENIIVLLERGKAKINNCIFSLNYLVKSCNTIIPAIWVEKDGSLSLTHSEVKGHDSKDTVGIVCRLGIIVVENCTINNHREGGILVWGIRENSSRIIKNLIEDNSVGVHLVGEEFKLKIISNSIRKNKIGIKVGLASQPDISRNLISQNEEGIEINSAFPLISLNKIEKNNQNGIVCRSYKKFLCRAIIRKNVGIAGNHLNGVLIEGQNNKTQLISNHLIGFNGESGIKVEKLAFPTIQSNKIYKNTKQGILVVENSNAIIEKNEITHNIQCNVAIGGINSHHSILIQNVISDSPGVGLYLIRSGQLKVIRNDISNNEDGVIITGAKPQVRRNYISDNRNNGIVCQNSSNPFIIENFVTRNSGVGLLLRHSSGTQGATIHSNIIVSNQIDASMQQYNKELVSELNYSNTIEGDIYYPQELSCQIM